MAFKLVFLEFFHIKFCRVKIQQPRLTRTLLKVHETILRSGVFKASLNFQVLSHTESKIQ